MLILFCKFLYVTTCNSHSCRMETWCAWRLLLLETISVLVHVKRHPLSFPCTSAMTFRSTWNLTSVRACILVFVALPSIVYLSPQWDWITDYLTVQYVHDPSPASHMYTSISPPQRTYFTCIHTSPCSWRIQSVRTNWQEARHGRVCPCPYRGELRIVRDLQRSRSSISLRCNININA